MALVKNVCLKQNNLFSIIEKKAVSHDTLTTFVHNVRSLLRHNKDIVSHDKIMNNDIQGLQRRKMNDS